MKPSLELSISDLRLLTHPMWTYEPTTTNVSLPQMVMEDIAAIVKWVPKMSCTRVFVHLSNTFGLCEWQQTHWDEHPDMVITQLKIHLGMYSDERMRHPGGSCNCVERGIPESVRRMTAADSISHHTKLLQHVERFERQARS